MNAGALDRLIQFRRAGITDGPFGQEETWVDYGAPQWASRKDVRDSEKWAAGQVTATILSRFTVRWSTFTASIGARDRFTCDGREWTVEGVKEGQGRRQWIEITATTGSD